MKNHFVKTSNYRRFRALIVQVEARGAQEAGWVLVTGMPGVGKTAMLKKWAMESEAVWLSAKQNWTVAYFLEDLAAQLGVTGKATARHRDAMIVGKLAREQIPIVIDEVEYCFANRYAILEQLRTISDASEIPVILAGMEDERRQNIQSVIANAMQFGSRVFHAFGAYPATLEDVGQMCAELLEFGQAAPDLQAAIHAQSKGVVRSVKNALSKVEGLAKRNKLEIVALADMEGVELCPDWKARRLEAR
jgi:DNA transposition AAA+ family ATPase